MTISIFYFFIYHSDFFYISLGNSMTHINNNFKAPTVFQQLFTNEEIAICLFFLLTSPIWFLAIFSVQMCQIFSGNFYIFEKSSFSLFSSYSLISWWYYNSDKHIKINKWHQNKQIKMTISKLLCSELFFVLCFL